MGRMMFVTLATLAIVAVLALFEPRPVVLDGVSSPPPPRESRGSQGTR